ncbi:LOW QUALITY PROTEIN: membrane protein [Geomicrobium sp. JCM 19038]|nr:LOW QUALITY PROTEIN: membrane protein [Geomicrobium sp. JCM 19038]
MKNSQEYFLLMLIVGTVALIGNWIGYDIFSIQAVLGMLVLILIASLGQLLSQLIPVKIPSVVYVIIIGIILSLPSLPWGPYVVEWTSNIQLLAIATPILAYAGIAIGRSWTDFVKMGWKAWVVCLLVLFGTLIGSAIIAEIVLRFQGII